MADISAIRNLANEGINLTKDVMGKVMKSVRGNDKRFFNSSKKGEIGEWRKKLHSLDVSEVTNAMKCVIAAMTIGTDVSMLFPDVISCIHDKTLELKKLVYLFSFCVRFTCRYLINYARAKPELIILAVNTFVRDCEDPNPLIRALALRTMACIRVKKIVEYLIMPLGKCIDDVDPYVRKTAAICIAKFYDMDPQRCEDEGFIERLRRMIGDSSPMVVANAVASLCDINDTRRAPSEAEAGEQTAGCAERVFRVGTDLLAGCIGKLYSGGRGRSDAHRGEDNSTTSTCEFCRDAGVTKLVMTNE